MECVDQATVQIGRATHGVAYTIELSAYQSLLGVVAPGSADLV